MSRRVSKLAVGILLLSLVLPAPGAFAARRGDQPVFTPIERIVRAVKKFVKTLSPASQDDPTVQPRPPIP